MLVSGSQLEYLRKRLSSGGDRCQQGEPTRSRTRGLRGRGQQTRKRLQVFS